MQTHQCASINAHNGVGHLCPMQKYKPALRRRLLFVI